MDDDNTHISGVAMLRDAQGQIIVCALYLTFFASSLLINIILPKPCCYDLIKIKNIRLPICNALKTKINIVGEQLSLQR